MIYFDDIVRAFWQRPRYQRLFLAFTVGLFLSCAARVAEGQPPTLDPGAGVGFTYQVSRAER